MVIKCTLSISGESIRDCAKQFKKLPPLPKCITKRSVYVNNKEEAAHQIIILYDFDKSQFEEVREHISNQLRHLLGLPGFTLSAHIYGPHPCHLTLEKGRELKHYRII
jgi:hypothetical protein